MRHAFIAALVPLALAAPAIAQQGSLEQPRTPDNGVGVDYTQPYLNDLLLRMHPLVDGNSILYGDGVVSCDKQRNALAEDPLDPALDQAYEQCIQKQQEQKFDWLLRQRRANPSPGAKPPLFVPEPNAPPLFREIPLSPGHPNAQH